MDPETFDQMCLDAWNSQRPDDVAGCFPRLGRSGLPKMRGFVVEASELDAVVLYWVAELLAARFRRFVDDSVRESSTRAARNRRAYRRLRLLRDALGPVTFGAVLKEAVVMTGYSFGDADAFEAMLHGATPVFLADEAAHHPSLRDAQTADAPLNDVARFPTRGIRLRDVEEHPHVAPPLALMAEQLDLLGEDAC